MITNVDVYFAIAEEALAEFERLEKLARRPKPDGEPGVIVTYDPQRKSFKNSLVSIVFAGMYLDALFYILGTKRFGKGRYNKKYDNKSLEEKLQLFGLSDKDLLAEAEQFRKRRRQLVHEKAVQISDLAVDTILHCTGRSKKSAFPRQRSYREISPHCSAFEGTARRVIWSGPGPENAITRVRKVSFEWVDSPRGLSGPSGAFLSKPAFFGAKVAVPNLSSAGLWFVLKFRGHCP